MDHRTWFYFKAKETAAAKHPRVKVIRGTTNKFTHIGMYARPPLTLSHPIHAAILTLG